MPVSSTRRLQLCQQALWGSQTKQGKRGFMSHPLAIARQRRGESSSARSIQLARTLRLHMRPMSAAARTTAHATDVRMAGGVARSGATDLLAMNAEKHKPHGCSMVRALKRA